MRAFLLYIDDWLASKKIARMDAHEERGYLRLLMRAATEPDCGLPDNDAELAIYSKLGQQWYKPTRDKDFRITAQTSGAKLRECFFVRDGRLFNERLLREFDHQKEVQSKRSKASGIANLARWGKDRSAKSESDPNQIPNGSKSESQTDPNDVCVCVSQDSLQKTGSSEEASFVSEKNRLGRGTHFLGPDGDFDYEAGFYDLWSNYPKKGREKIEDAKRMYVEKVSPDPVVIHSRLMEEILPGGKWIGSEKWRKGYIFGVFEYLRNTRWLEDPEQFDPNAKSEHQNGSSGKKRKSLTPEDLERIEQEVRRGIED